MATEAEPALAGVTEQTIDGIALARLYGEPLFTLPTDLYIPPDALEVFLEAFEGPLDLLFAPDQKEKRGWRSSISRSPPSLEQYLAYLEVM